MTRTNYENSVCTVALILILSHSPLKYCLIKNSYASSNTISRNHKSRYISSYVWMQITILISTLRPERNIRNRKLMQKIGFVSNITGVCSHDKLTANQGWGLLSSWACGDTWQIWIWIWSNHLTYTFAKSKFPVTEKLANGPLVTPIPALPQVMAWRWPGDVFKSNKQINLYHHLSICVASRAVSLADALARWEQRSKRHPFFLFPFEDEKTEYRYSDGLFHFLITVSLRGKGCMDRWAFPFSNYCLATQ